MDFPSPNDGGLPPTITTGGRFGVGLATRLATGSTAPASAAWPAANQANFSPIWLPFRYPVKQIFIANGATAAGNADVGIYTTEGELIVSSGSTAQTGTTTLQFFSVDVVLPPNQYYLACAYSSATSTRYHMGIGSGGRRRLLGLLQQSTAFPLPTTATFAAGTTAVIPIMGITRQSTANF